jgi:hypothetical protein
MPHFAITRQQREALFRVFQRDFPSWVSPTRRYQTDQPCPHCGQGGSPIVKVPTLQWRKFRRQVLPTFFRDGSITVPWQGMWLCIEKCGYTHS